jgi:predicted ferric reductase
VLLWVSMVSGLMITNKMARTWPGAFTAFDLHQFTSLLGLGFAVFHMLVLLGNRFVPYDLAQLLVPFAGAGYRPLWVGIGQIALYLTVLVTFTFYVRRQIGNRLWHLIHLLSYLVFAMVLVHGLTSGTDSGNAWVLGMYWLSGISLAALMIHRMSVNRTVSASG